MRKNGYQLFLVVLICVMATMIVVPAWANMLLQNIFNSILEPECFMILAGKDATVDASVLLAHNNDL